MEILRLKDRKASSQRQQWKPPLSTSPHRITPRTPYTWMSCPAMQYSRKARHSGFCTEAGVGRNSARDPETDRCNDLLGHARARSTFIAGDLDGSNYISISGLSSCAMLSCDYISKLGDAGRVVDQGLFFSRLHVCMKD